MKKGHKKGNKEPRIIPDFIQVPYQVFTDEKLSSTDKFVYGAVYFFYNTTVGKKCTASNETLGDLIKTTASTVSNSLVILEERKYIKREYYDNTCRRRKEIIPMVVVTKLMKNKSRVQPESETKVQPESETKLQKTDTPQSESDTPQSERQLIPSKTVKNVVYTTQNTNFDNISDTPQSEERKKEERTTRKNYKKDLIFPSEIPSELVNDFGQEIVTILVKDFGPDIVTNDFGPDIVTNDFGSDIVTNDFGSDIVTISEDPINKAIALFLPYFPGDFSGKSSAFAKPPTRAAVKELLKRYNHLQLADLLRRWDEKRTEQFRPEAGTVYEFCTYKLAKIESFLEKEGGLWAQRSISTRAQKADSDELIRQKIDASRERTRQAKEDWLRDHPEENLE